MASGAHPTLGRPAAAAWKRQALCPPTPGRARPASAQRPEAAVRCQVVPTRLLRGTLGAPARASYPSGRLLLPSHPRCDAEAGLGPGVRADARPPQGVDADKLTDFDKNLENLTKCHIFAVGS